MKLLLKWILSAVDILLAAYLLPGVYIRDFKTALLVALVLGIINVTIKPVLFILTLPVTVLTLGLFVLILNALMIYLVTALVPGFYITSFWWALLFGLLVSIFNSIMYKLISRK